MRHRNRFDIACKLPGGAWIRTTSDKAVDVLPHALAAKLREYAALIERAWTPAPSGSREDYALHDEVKKPVGGA